MAYLLVRIICIGLCPELDQHRATYDDMDSFLTGVAKEQLFVYQHIEALYIEYLPQVGYVMALSRILQEEEAVDVNSSNGAADVSLRYLFGTAVFFVWLLYPAATYLLLFMFIANGLEREGTFYYKNRAMEDLDESVGDIHGIRHPLVNRKLDILFNIYVMTGEIVSCMCTADQLY
jgi:hypothetical protein